MSISQAKRLAAITKRTGDLTPSMLRHLEEFGYLSDLDADDYDPNELVAVIRSLKMVSADNPFQTPAILTSNRRERSGKRGTPSSRYRRVVISLWRWEEARRDQEVMNFRRDVLKGSTIPFEELAMRLPQLQADWEKGSKAAQADKAHAASFKQWVESNGGMARFFSEPARLHPSVFYEFARGYDPTLVPEKWMVDIAGRLAEEFAWTVYEGIVVLLSDSCPLLPAVRVRSQLRSSGNQKLILEVEPTATPQEVLGALQHARTEMMGHRYRPLSDKRLQLAFVTYPLAKRHSAGTRRKGVSTDPDLTWEALYRRWNGSYPDSLYSTKSNFRRDSLSAHQELFSPRYRDVDDSHGEMMGTFEGVTEFLDGLASEA